MELIFPPKSQLAAIIAFIFVATFTRIALLSSPALPPHTSPASIPITITATPAPSATPTPAPLTFAQMNTYYGPCTHTPALTYHHIQTAAAAKANNQAALTVDTDVFAKQLQYLSDHGYTPVTPSRIIDFFDHGTPLPAKSVLLTFDDGYSDFFTDAAPILASHNFPAVMFLPTGLVNNPDYLTWSQISQLNGRITFANHTWSHRSLATATDIISREITTADTQLTDHGLNSPKTFAYPYGTVTAAATDFLTRHGYTLAFTTRYGSILCAKQRLTLPRLPIGPAPLSAYGL